MFASRIVWLLGAALLAAFVGACGLPAPAPTPEPLPQPVPEPDEPVPTAPAEDLKALAEGNNAFAIDLYKKLAETEKGNIVVSPYSIRTALAMTYAGARGQTAEEMMKVLHFTLPDDKLHPAFGAAAHQLKGGKDKPYQLNVANALWGQTGFSFRKEFLELNRKYYSTGFRELDFAGDTEGSRQTINRWVGEKTREKIKELLKAGDIDRQVKLVLTNAIYFKGAWATPFPPNQTNEGVFETGPEQNEKVRMMNVRGDFCFRGSPRFDLLELLYAGHQTSMVLLLPRKRCALAEVEGTLTAECLREEISKLIPHSGAVQLPLFRTKSHVILNGQLKNLGLIQAFAENADFTGITASGLSLAKVIHSCDIEVAERGVEASAATAVTLKHISAPPHFSFQANHPFLYLIIDRKSQMILFIGRFTMLG